MKRFLVLILCLGVVMNCAVLGLASQYSLVIPAGPITGLDFHNKVNNAFDTLATLNSGPSEPAVKYAYMFWADTNNGLLKLRNPGNDAWIILGSLSADRLGLAQLNQVVQLSGDQTIAGAKSFSSFPITPASAPSANYQAANKKYVDDQIGAIPAPPQQVPIGSGCLWFAASPPSGYLLCDGSAVSRTTYSALFAVIGTVYGAGNGSTTFNLPDLRQKFPLGKASSGTGSTLGGSGGQIDHTHTTPAHSHFLANPYSSGDPGIQATDNITSLGYPYNNNCPITDTSGAGTTGTGNPPFQVVNYIIKY